MTAVILWWLAAQVCGLVILPLAWRFFSRLPSRGYALAKAFGLLLVAYTLWAGASLRVLPNRLGGILVSLLLVAAISFWLGRTGLQRRPDGGRPLFQWLAANWRLALATESLFLAALVGWTVFRAYNPEIAATEKPMEFAFINGVLNSRFFPPQDPWLSGYGISYYYFGYVMLGILIRLTGVAPALGFNLGVALWYALVLVGAFGIGYDLVSLATRRLATAVAEVRGIRYGLLSALFVGILGNLEGLAELAYNRRLLPVGFFEWLDIKELMRAEPSGGWTGDFWWWWRASRTIHDRDLLGSSVEVIDEFPFFSFLLGDLHPHVLALPFVLLAISLALNLLLRASRDEDEAGGQGLAVPDEATVSVAPSSVGLVSRAVAAVRPLEDVSGLGMPGMFLVSVLLGGLAFLNTWDFPIYLALVALALGAGWVQRDGLTDVVALRTLAAGLLFGVVGVLAYLPFYLGFQSQAGGLLPNLLFPTRLPQFLVMFGPFLVIAVFFLGILARRAPAGLAGRIGVALGVVGLVPLVMIGLLVLVALLLPQAQGLVDELYANPAVAASIEEPTITALLQLVLRIRLANPWTYLFLAVLAALAIGLLWNWGAAPDRASVPLRRTDVFVLLLIGLSLLLTFSVEFVYLRDLFGTRMNTVFKFYYQAWVMLGLAAAYGISRLAERATPTAIRVPALLFAGILVLGGLYYPVMATPAKTNDFAAGPTLDGLAYLRQNNPGDAAAIEWIRQNLPPDAVILEAPGGSYSTEGAQRVSMATGNPTLLGWDWHERQWRGETYGEVSAGRAEAADRIYRSASPEELSDLLARWDIDYVYVGALERQKYGIGDASLARLDRALPLVYEQDGVRIYGAGSADGR